MNAIFLLMGLLVLSYLGGFLVGKRGAGVVGLPAGLEYVVLGFVLSPTLLGLVERSTLESFSPLVHVGLGWLALIVGLDFGYAGKSRVTGKVLVIGAIGAAITFALVASASYALLDRFALLGSMRDRIVLACGLAAATSETTRHAVRWVIERYRAQGPVSELLHGFASTDDLVPLLALGALLAFASPGAEGAGHADLDVWLRIGLTVGLGVLLGFVAVILIGKKVDGHAVWGALLGTALLGVGTASRLGLATMTITFVQGITMAALSKQRTELRVLLAPTERAVLLPTLVLAGTRLDFGALLRNRLLLVVVLCALVARVVGKLASGLSLRAVTPALRKSRTSIGLGLLSSGALSVGIGLLQALRFPGPIGDTILVAATLSLVLGEAVSPRIVRRLLADANELDKAPPSHLDEEETRDLSKEATKKDVSHAVEGELS